MFIQYLRGTALVALLVVLPFAQLIAIRIGPAFICFALIITSLCLLINRDGQEIKAHFKIMSPIARKLVFLIIAVFIWASISLFWSLDRTHGIRSICASFMAFISVWFLSYHFAKLPFIRFKITLFIGIFCTMLALALGLNWLQGFNVAWGINHSPYDYNRLAIALCLLMPALIWNARYGAYETAFSIFLALASLYYILASESETAKLGFIAFFILTGACYFMPFLKKWITIGMGVTLIAMPLIPTVIEKINLSLPKAYSLMTSAHHRLQIWKGYRDFIYEKLFLGWGMESDGPLGEIGAVTRYTAQLGFDDNANSPHNFAFELWVNLGLIGIIPIAIILVLLGWLPPSKSKYNDALLTGLIATIFTMSLTGTSGFQGWWIAAIIIALTSFKTCWMQAEKTKG